MSSGALARAARSTLPPPPKRALLRRRTAPTVEDVRTVALPILRHRIIPNYQAVGNGIASVDIVRSLLEKVAQ